MGIWVILHRLGLFRIVLLSLLFANGNGKPHFVEKLEAFFESSGSYVKTFKDVLEAYHTKRAPLINSFISASLARASRDTLLRKPQSSSDIYSLNIEPGGSDGANVQNTHSNDAGYNEISNKSNDNEHHFQPKWRERVYVERNKNLITTHAPISTVKQSDVNITDISTNLVKSSNFVTSGSNIETNNSLLTNFLKPTEKSISSFISGLSSTSSRQTEENTLVVDPLAENRESPTTNPLTMKNSSKIKSTNSIFSFFAEENKKPVNEIEEFNSMEDSDDDFESDNHVFMHHNIPILSGLIHGTLNEDMSEKNGQFKEIVDSLKNFNYVDNNPKNSTVSHFIPESIKLDLEDPDSIEQTNQSTNSVPKLMESLLKATVPSEHDVYQHPINAKNESRDIYQRPINASNEPISSRQSRPATNENKIEFIRLPQENSTKYGSCMDGTPPGYYFRRGLTGNLDKWIIHLHGGAWCYDLKTCMKRRNSILGSTNSSVLEDINSFFHGILSKSSNINPNFYDWNVAVLSYCDGGLFSGNRKRPLTGKGKSFFFQGRSILKSLLQEIRSSFGGSVSEIILSGTSAGGLAVVLQGDFIRKFFSNDVKIRGLVDAGVFLDQTSLLGDSIARQQFRALYSLHKPLLNKECLASVSKRERYTCLFPEKALLYMNLSVFIVNSLYDHWQLSYLEGINCVFDNMKCDTNQHDRILQFRNHMFTALKNISSVKNDTGIFANSCFAHGQVIIDYTWTKININSKSIAQSFYNWYKDNDLDKNQKKHLLVDCKYPCNGSCAKLLAEKCVKNFKAASERRRKRDAELC